VKRISSATLSLSQNSLADPPKSHRFSVGLSFFALSSELPGPSHGRYISACCARNGAGKLIDLRPGFAQASAIRDLAVLAIAITAFIFLVVEGTLIYSIVRFRRSKTATASEPPQVYGSHAIEIARTVAPALIVVILILVVARTESEVRADPPPPKPGDNALYVTVVGRQWWWEYRYETSNGE
jgi:heme/copper-type cytochrome/quinol oxidase subunit 2